MDAFIFSFLLGPASSSSSSCASTVSDESIYGGVCSSQWHASRPPVRNVRSNIFWQSTDHIVECRDASVLARLATSSETDPMCAIKEERLRPSEFGFRELRSNLRPSPKDPVKLEHPLFTFRRDFRGWTEQRATSYKRVSNMACQMYCFGRWSCCEFRSQSTPSQLVSQPHCIMVVGQSPSAGPRPYMKLSVMHLSTFESASRPCSSCTTFVVFSIAS